MPANKLEKSSLIIIILFLILAPFNTSSFQDDFPAVEINESNLGYYQTNTCKISLTEVLAKNISNLSKITINPNSYPGLECLGKVTGLDLIGKKFVLSVGLNTNISFIVQSFLWLILMFLFSSKREKVLKFSFVPIPILSTIFLSQLYFEERFYRPLDKNFDLDLSFSNLYLINFFLSYTFIFLLIKEFAERRKLNILYFVPIVFIFSGTYFSQNLNFYLLFFAYFGFLNVLVTGSFRYFNYGYLTFLLLWLSNIDDRLFFFDTDKLRGFVNSSNSLGSTLYWAIVFYLFINGFFYFFNENVQNFSLNKLKNYFLYSSVVLNILGLIGTSTVGNFFNFFIFGQTKKGMQTLTPIAGNTWRGFSPSAELIGEFYGICLIITFYCVINSYTSSIKKDVLLSFFAIGGLVASNNVASIVSSVAIILILFISSKKLIINKKITSALIILALLFSVVLVDKETYDYSSTILINEAILHSDLYQFEDNYRNSVLKRNFFNDRDYLSLLNDENNYLRASSSLITLVNVFSPTINIPIIPNSVATVSVVATYINRVELWGIFIAKYNPSINDFLFGKGPNQITNYLYEHDIRLDFKEPKASGLFLPHSSLLDLLLFYGIVGLLIICCLLIRKIQFSSAPYNLFSYLLIFIMINLTKSDSILYVEGFVMAVTIYLMVVLKNKIRI
jgi:hypothetical protein